ncbi:hypothetical protein SASPL_108919 [Salvia splendens]|uniref:AP2/ERF domain-containing protein n=1 Tax=Salvia splendens TaxID=180675 RepID=A0A8X8YJ41_SALSN|nr:hypothetical protein SASPL_108919 [Salvia splendens]
MESVGETKSIAIDSIIPLEDVGLEDCSLPPDSIREAFWKAASAVRSIVSDEGGCVEDPWEESSYEGCMVEKGGGWTEAAGDRVVVVGDAEEKVDDYVIWDIGAYDDEEAAAHAYDLAALKYWGQDTILNFPLSTYQKEILGMDGQSREEYIGSLRRKSRGFSRGVSKYRGVARCVWLQRIG